MSLMRKKVCENLKNLYQNVSVLTIEKPIFSTSKILNTEQNKCVKNFLEINLKHIVKLDEICNNFDSEKLSYYEISILIKNLLEEILTSHESLMYSLNKNPKFNLAKNYAQQILLSYQTLSNTKENQISHTLRYETINIITTRFKLISCF